MPAHGIRPGLNVFPPGVAMAERHPLQHILAPILLPLSLLYGFGGSLRRRMTRRGKHFLGRHGQNAGHGLAA